MNAPFFTKENAKEFAVKAVETRKQLAEERRLTLEALRNPTDDFREDMVKSTRAQIRLIASKIDKELERSTIDSKVIKELSETMTRLEAIEQKLSMRSGPGTLKPSNKPQKPRSSAQSAPEPQDDPPPTS